MADSRLRRAARLALAGIVCLSACEQQPTEPVVTIQVIAFSGLADSVRDIYTIREDGTGLTNLTRSPEADFRPSWSPDRRSIAFSSSREPAGLWIMNADGSDPRPLAAAAQVNGIAWSPDGSRLVFAAWDLDSARLIVMRPDGTDRTTLLRAGVTSPSWSPDGATILYTQQIGGAAGTNVFAISPNGGAPREVTRSEFFPLWFAGDGVWSPDGSMIAYVRADVDRGVWLMKADGSERTQISSGDDRYPKWLRTGQIVVQRTFGTRSRLFIIASDGTSETELVTGLESSLHPSR